MEARDARAQVAPTEDALERHTATAGERQPDVNRTSPAQQGLGSLAVAIPIAVAHRGVRGAGPAGGTALGRGALR